MAISLDYYYNQIENTIVNKIYHPFYKRTLEVKELNTQIITGLGADKLLRRFVRREDDALFAQRVELTQQITSAVSAIVMNPFYKVGRTNNIVKKIDFNGSTTFEEKKKKLEEVLSKYYGEETLDSYLNTRFTNLSFIDPNAFIITEFEGLEELPNGKMEGLPYTYPFEASSEMCINYEYENNNLEWLIIEVQKELKSGEKKQIASDYTIYLKEYSIKYTQFIPTNNLKEIKKGVKYEVLNELGETVIIFRADNKRFFIVEEFNHKAKEVPAKCVGYKQDLITNGKTFVSPLHDAMPFFLKTIKTVSEFDLTMALHAFPQKFQYAPRCQGTMTEPCDSGRLPNGTNCGMCKGTGYAIHTSAQDAVTIRLPKNKDEMYDLNMLSTYKYPPIDLLTFQKEYIKELEDSIKKAVFNSETFNKNESFATATENKISLESVYDTIYPFAVKYSQMYEHIVRVSAYYQDVQDLTVIHRFPKDFKFKTLDVLLDELKKANDSNAPGYVRKELSSDIAAIQFEDKPEELLRISIKQKFYPFPDKTDAEIIYIISNGLTTEYNKVLWSNFDNIFNDLEYDAELEEKYFYDYSYKVQKEKLLAKVNEYIVMIESDMPEEPSLFGTAINGQNDNDEENNSNGELDND